ncbi:helix-turn-helix transcriptional regulator [Herbiconiux sp. L3-i23]|uniref:helix-turn-helix transcriptional regulator n=1 Tax=Herbiconiux sp. L3-i23 TaxID=2905871 RepID=UPI00206E5D60|nr:helix-turn-helix transcriptional regulator [Herbiconiux sp. L3-i23]BDI21884.1 hypothetical protein L3i23_06600 [Herbiconiux sp. L3-i23]
MVIGYAALVLIVVGIVLVGPMSDAGPVAVVLTVAGCTVLVIAGAALAGRRLYETGRSAPLPPPPTPTILVDRLIPRERDVLEALADGASNAGIASRLVVSERTVDSHVRSIFAKLGLDDDKIANRRVRAARVFFDAERAARR